MPAAVRDYESQLLLPVTPAFTILDAVIVTPAQSGLALKNVNVALGADGVAGTVASLTVNAAMTIDGSAVVALASPKVPNYGDPITFNGAGDVVTNSAVIGRVDVYTLVTSTAWDTVLTGDVFVGNVEGTLVHGGQFIRNNTFIGLPVLQPLGGRTMLTLDRSSAPLASISTILSSVNKNDL